MTTIYSADGFSGAFGTTDGSGSLDPATWTTVTGTFATAASQAQTSASTANSIAYIESSQSNVAVQCTFATLASTMGVLFRYVDSTHYWAFTYTSAGAWTLGNANGSASPSTVTSGTGGSANDVILVVANGNSIQVFKNGTFLTSTSSANQNTGTKHGLYNNSNTTARFDTFSIALPNAIAMTPSHTQTPSFTKAITKATATLSKTQTQTPTIARGTGHGQTLSVTQTQTPSNTQAVGHVTSPSGSESAPTYTIQVCDMSGTVSQTLTAGEIDKIRWTLNQPDEFEFHFPKGAYTNSQVASLNVGSTVTEVQLYRNSNLMTWGPIVQLQGAGKDGAVKCAGKGVDWYMNRRFIDGPIGEYLSNTDFETDFTGWTTNGSFTKTVTTAQFVTGAHSAKLTCSSTGHNTLEQIIFVNGQAEGQWVLFSAWFFIESFNGPCENFHGLYVEGYDANGLVYRGNNYYPIDSATPRNQWVKASCALMVPYPQSWFIQVHLCAINGTIYWDDVKAVNQSSLTAEGAYPTFPKVDTSTAVRHLVNHVQDTAAGDKSPLNIGFRGATTGVLTGGGGNGWAFVDHTQFDTALHQYIDRSDGIDYYIEYTPATRTFVQMAHKRGTDRHASITLKYIAGDTTSNCVDYDFSQDAGQCITRQTVIGNDQGFDREQGIVKDTSNTAGIVLEDVRQAPQHTEIADLQFIAQQRINLYSKPPRVITMMVKGSTGYVNTLDPGDLVTVQITDGYVIVNDTFRIQQMELDCKTNMLAVTVAKDDLS